MLLPTSYIVSNLCIYTAATAAMTKIKEKIHFHVRFRFSINEPLWEFQELYKAKPWNSWEP